MTQEYWINQELEDYKYMLTIADGPIKRQVERDWPYDYTTQKYWYNEQVEAKERLNGTTFNFFINGRVIGNCLNRILDQIISPCQFLLPMISGNAATAHHEAV